ncbi:hypothetical protein C7H19_12985 [Aphanothece hegewaldii CCALA 016]|uniref:Transposase n=1 Tax=Aphanothece hegewaldii CCALA 016 TaxID=2107694 RepID=A0A2T1LWW4_9CHRO|nr:helix-turn-helix domain-containing protein [Aphanothece hegewaldii]PSF36589.1 hypothetical protein C7H19_12985 [Aphanothece hegewaldii CCALA 016]
MSKPLRGDYKVSGIEKIYKECKDPKIKERLLAIKMIYSGEKITDVAEHLSYSHKTVYKWVDSWNELGVEGLKPQQRGKPRKPYLTEEEWTKIIEEIKDKGYNLQKLQEYVLETRGVNYTYKGIWTMVRRKLKVPYGKPYIINSKQSETAEKELKKN